MLHHVGFGEGDAAAGLEIHDIDVEVTNADPKTHGPFAENILKGKVRRLGNQVRISVRLIKVKSGEHLWAERFDRPIDDLFEILDELVSRIVGTIVGRVEAADMAEARRKRGLSYGQSVKTNPFIRFPAETVKTSAK